MHNIPQSSCLPDQPTLPFSSPHENERTAPHRTSHPPTHPSDALLSSVLERGSGSCAALCVLYLSVCQRLGLEMSARVLRDERGTNYCVAWPTAQPIQAGGVRCVVDVYGRGALLTVNEVRGLRHAF